MTNWLTAAGLALFAGGLATLICFRAVLFGDGERRPRRRARASDSPERANRRRRTDTMEPRRRSRPPAQAPAANWRVADDHGGLASIGFADDEAHDDREMHYETHDEAVDALNADALYQPEEQAAYREIEYGEVDDDQDVIDYPDEDPDPPTVLDRSPRRVGHRAEGWIRPEYSDLAPGESGDYWTPLPADNAQDREPSARGYGWPVPVERLPPVPAYEPATGFDLKPVPAEPTEVVSAWSPGDDEFAGRIHLPRAWPARDDKARRRPRPRPRPAASDGVYVSRHAADPPR